jgi:hypothetical protein
MVASVLGYQETRTDRVPLDNGARRLNASL